MLIACVGFLCLFILLFLGIPIAFGMAAVGLVGFAYVVGLHPALAMTGTLTFDTTLDYSLSVIALFVLMGNFVHASRLSDELYAAANSFLGHLRGGLAMATISACGAFAAVSGSSVATAATMGKVAMPAMRRYGYSDTLAAGSIAAGGTLGILVPPSTALVIYGLLTETNVSKLFLAGIIPGILTVLLYILVIFVVTTFNPALGPSVDRANWHQRIQSLKSVWAILLLFVLVMGGLYAGAFTATEAGGIGATGAFLLALFRGRLTFKIAIQVLVETARTTSMLMIVIVGALIFSNFLDVSGLPAGLSAWITGLNLSPLLLMSAVVFIYILLGIALDGLALMLLTVPLFFPIVSAQGIDPVYFGIIVVVVIEIGLISPPIGMNMFVLSGQFPDIPMKKIFLGVIPFLVADFIKVVLFLLFPAIILFLPHMAG